MATIKFPNEMPVATSVDAGDTLMIAKNGVGQPLQVAAQKLADYLNITAADWANIEGLTLPDQGDFNKVARVLGGPSGKTYTWSGGTIPVQPNHEAILYWDGAAETWSLQNEAPIPKGEDGQNGENLYPDWTGGEADVGLTFPLGRVDDGKIYRVIEGETAGATDRPSLTPTKWEEINKIALGVANGAAKFEVVEAINDLLKLDGIPSVNNPFDDVTDPILAAPGGGKIYVIQTIPLYAYEINIGTIYCNGNGLLEFGHVDAANSNYIKLGDIEVSLGSIAYTVDYILPVNRRLAIRTNGAAQITYAVDQPGKSAFGSDTGTIIDGFYLQYGFKSKGSGGENAIDALENDIVATNERVLVVEELITEIQPKKESYLTNLFSDDFSTEKTDWLKSGWAYSSDGYSNSSNYGVNNRLQLNRMYNVDMRVMRFKFLPSATTDLRIYLHSTVSANTNADTEGASGFGINFSTKKIVIYNVAIPHSGDPNVTGSGVAATVLQSIDFNYTSINDFEIELSYEVTKHTLRLINKVTGEEFTLIYDGWAGGRQQQYYSMYLVAGGCTIKNFQVKTLSNIDTLIMGDSITEGVMVLNKSLRWAQQLKKYLGGLTLVSARGGHGSIDIVAKLASELDFIKPKRIVLLIGINAYNPADFVTIYNYCTTNNIQLLLCTYNATTSGMHTAINNFLRSNYAKNIGAEFDYATSVNHDKVTPISGILYDGLHPNNEGNVLMYNRSASDLIV